MSKFIRVRERELMELSFIYSVNEIILNEKGEAEDFLILDVNPDFERACGKKESEITGKKASEICPEFFSAHSQFIQICGQVAVHGDEQTMELYFEPFQGWYKLMLFKTLPNRFAMILMSLDRERLIAKNAELLLNQTGDAFDFQLLCHRARELSDAKFASFNVFEENGKAFRTVAVSGINRHIKKAIDYLGFDFRDKQWPEDPERTAKIQKRSITRFKKLADLTGDRIKPSIIQLLCDTFKVGETFVLTIKKGERLLGDFTLMMEKGRTLQNESLLKIFARQIGLALERSAALQKFYKTTRILNETSKIARLGTWEVDLQKNEHFWSDITRAIFEVDDDYKPEMSLALRFYPEGESRERITVLVETAIEKGERFDAELPIITAKGNKKWIRTTGQAELTDGKCCRIYGTIKDISARKQNELELIEKKELLANITENITDMVSLTDLEGNYTYIASVHTALGYEKNDLLGKNVLEYVHPEDFLRIQTLFQDSMKNHQATVKTEFRYRRKDGYYIWLETNGKILYDENGKPKELLFSSRDITERKKSEANLRLSEEKHRNLVEHAPIIFYKYSNKNGAIYWSSQVKKILGYAPDELHQDPFLWVESIHPEDRVAVRNAIEASEKGADYQIEYRIQRKDEQWIWLRDEFIHKDVRDDEILIEGLAYDITNQIEAKEAISESEKRFRGLANDLPALVCEFLPDSTLNFVNNAYCDYFSQTKEALIGKKFYDFLPETEVAKSRSKYEALSRENPLTKYVHSVMVNGELRMQEWVDRAIFDEEGKVAFYRGVGFDITDRKKAEMELRKNERFLEQVLSTTADGFWVLDSVGKIVRVNDAACAFSGYSREELLTMKISDINTTTPPQEIKARMKRIFQNGSELFEAQYCRKDGVFVDVEVSASYLSQDGGHFVVFSRIITKRKEAEKALQKANRRLEETNRLARIGSWEKNLITGEDDWSELTRQIHEVDDDFVPNMENSLKFYKEGKSRDTIVKLVEKTIAGGEAYDVELEFITAKGNAKWVRTTGQGEFIDGKCVRLFGSFQDITQRKIAELEREKQTRFLERVLATTQDGFWYIKSDGHILDANAAYCQMTGYSREEMQKMHIKDLDALENKTDVKARMEKIRELGSIKFETQHRRKDGTLFDIEISVSYLPADNQFIAFGRDITQRKKAEAALQESEEKFRQISENTEEVIWLRDAVSQELLYINPAYEKVWGRTCQSLLDNSYTFKDSIDPDDLPLMEAEYEKYFQTGKFDLEYRIVRPEGDLRWIRARTYPVYDSGGRMIRTVGIATDITERVQNRKKLEKEHHRLESILTGTQAGTWEWHIQSGELFINARWAEMLGYRYEEIAPVTIKTWEKLTNPEDLPNAEKLLEEHFKGITDAYECEFRMKHKDGSWVWVLGRGQVLVWSDDKKPLVMYGTHQDISYRKMIEDTVTEQAHFMKALIQSIPNPIFYKDTEGRYLGCNPAFEKLIGKSHKEILSRTVEELFSAEQAGIFRRQDNDLFEKGGVQIYESQYGDADNLRDVIFHKSTFSDGSGKVAGIIGSVLDITKVKKAEAEIKRQTGLIRALINNVDDLIFYKDTDGVYLGCNDEFAHHLGKDKSEIVGSTDYDHYSKEEADEFRKNDLIVLESGIARHNEEWINYPDGRRVYLDTLKSRLYDSDGQLIGTIGISRDITERKSQEIMLQQSKRELEDALSSLDEAQSKMIEQEKLAAVGKLAGGIAHEFNNLLAGIMGFAEMMQERLHKREFVNQGLAAILNNGERGAKLVKQILDFSRRSIGQRIPIDLVDLVNRSTVFLRNLLPENITVSVASRLMDSGIMGDEHQLENVLTNLALNARDAMPDGGDLNIRVDSMKNEEFLLLPGSKDTLSPGKWITMIIEDSGWGIKPEIMPRIFEPFFTSKEVGQGSGMGLPQAMGILKQHGGSIGIESEPGKGTKVTLYFPFAGDADKEENPFPSDEVQMGKGQELLLVEDDATVRETSKMMLESIHYEVTAAKDGREALAILTENPQKFSLIISDMVMPAMGGLLLAKKAQELNPGLKVLIITGYPSEEDRKDAYPANVAAVIQKPVGLKSLSAAVKQIIGK
jgi:PAS domain S-box-containing protein